MGKKLCSYLAISLTLLIAHASYAQKAPIKFGKIDIADLEMTHYPLDSNAHAVILCDYGEAEMAYDVTLEDFFINFERHIRIKIIDKAGFDYADFEIPLYKAGRSTQDQEIVNKFKAATYNLVDGKIVETKVAKKDVISEEVSENRMQEKVAMPEIKEGSIIEIQYSIRSPFTWNLYDWQFQYDIPVKYSEYNVEYPDWFNYKIDFKGYDYNYLTVKDASEEPGKITFHYRERTAAAIRKQGASSNAQTSTIDYIKKKHRYVAENMPAFVPERYTSSTKNYLTTVNFELASQQYPGGKIQNFTQSWEDINKLLWENDRVGGQLGGLKVKSFEDEAMAVKSTKSTPAEQIAAIYHHVKKKILWNGQTSKYASEDIKKTYKEEKGNIADINLVLTAMLRAAGFDAQPMVLSTRSNGYLNEYFPNMSQFDYLITAVKMENGQYWILDASERSLPMDLLPPRCINGKGMVVAENGPIWIDLNPSGKYRQVRQVKATLNDDLTWSGTMDVKHKDYAARGVRQEYANEGDEAAYIQMIENDYTGLKISNAALEDFKTLAEETKESYEIIANDQVIDGGDLLYFNPMLMFGMEENPFKLKERKYPVDYNYPYENVYAATLEIPENYTIEELPENLSIALPNNGGKFSYSLNNQGNTLNLTSQLKISKHLFLPEEYASLKEFYNLAVEKMAAQVVLKKKG